LKNCGERKKKFKGKGGKSKTVKVDVLKGARRRETGEKGMLCIMIKLWGSEGKRLKLRSTQGVT